MSNHYAVAFSGGGALAAWQVGCLEALEKQHGARPIAVSGASAGAINAAAVSAGYSVEEMTGLWSGLKRETVFRTRRAVLFAAAAKTYWGMIASRSVLKGFERGASSLQSLYDVAPLETTLRRIFSGSKLDAFLGAATPCVMSVTSLENQVTSYHSNSATLPGRWVRMTHQEDLINILLASAAIPMAFPPRLGFVDGGVLRNQPVEALRQLCAPGVILYVLIPGVTVLPQKWDLSSIAGTLVQTWLGAGLLSDLDRIGVVNTVNVALKEELYPVCVIRPRSRLENLGSGVLMFGKNVSAVIEQGRGDAEAVLREFNPADPATWPSPARPLK